MPGHIQHIQRNMILIQLENIQTITCQFIAGTVEPHEFGAINSKHFIRQQGLLYAGRCLKVTSHAFVRLCQFADSPAVTQCIFYTSPHHGKVQRLGNIVIRTKLQGRNYIFTLVPGGRHDNR